MKNKLFFLSILLLLTYSNNLLAQTKGNSKNTDKLSSIKTLIDFNGLTAKLSWDAHHASSTTGVPISSQDVPKDIDDFISKNYPASQLPFSTKENNLLKKYQTKIDSTFNELTLFGSGQLAQFVYDKSAGAIPIRFCLQNDTALTLLLQGAYIDKLYNVSLLTSRQRAKTVITQHLLPTLKRIYEQFQSFPEIKHFAISSVYGTKDFSDNVFFATTSEYVAFIIPSKLLKKYSKADITEDELINLADVFLIERGLASELKKIKISVD